jgi:TRAP-type mannitol/chloroaromatic compound transport system substrate-binding protein
MRTKRTSWVVLIGMVFCLSVCLVLTSPQEIPAQVQVMKWRFQTHLGSAETSYKTLADFCAEVKKMSGGRLDITIYQGNAIVPPVEIMDAVGKGVLEMGFATGSYHLGSYPEFAVETGLPMGWRGLSDQLVVNWERGLEPFLRETYKKANIHLLPLQSNSGIMLISRKPINSVKDFVGLKVRTFGQVAKFFQALGSTTVSVPGGEIFMGLQLGTFDAATWGSEASFYEKKFYEVAKYILLPKIVDMHNNAIYVNLDRWNKLPDDLKAIITGAAIAASANTAARMLAEDAESFQKYMKPSGVKYAQMSPNDMDEMSKAAGKVWAEIAGTSPRAKQGVKIITDYLREKGYTTFDVERLPASTPAKK